MPCYATQKWFDLYPEDTLVLPPVKDDDRDDVLELVAVAVRDAEDLGDDGQGERIAEHRDQVGGGAMVAQFVQ